MSGWFFSLVAAVFLVTFGAVWIATDAEICIPGRACFVAPRLSLPSMSFSAAPADAERRSKLQQALRPLNPFVAGGASAIGDGSLNDLDAPCVDALLERASQLTDTQSADGDQPLPAPEDDTCNAAENEHLLEKDRNYFSGDPSTWDISARRFRMIGLHGSLWMTRPVREACAASIDPTRLNLESYGSRQILWCG